jgi:hypothetical protein
MSTNSGKRAIWLVCCSYRVELTQLTAVECLWEVAIMCRWQNWYYKSVVRGGNEKECEMGMSLGVNRAGHAGVTRKQNWRSTFQKKKTNKKANDKDRKTKKTGCLLPAFLFFVKPLRRRSFTFQSIWQCPRSFPPVLGHALFEHNLVVSSNQLTKPMWQRRGKCHTRRRSWCLRWT